MSELAPPPAPFRLIVVGNGMVGQRFVERVLSDERSADVELIVVGEETRPAYDRVALSTWFEDGSDDKLNLVDAGYLDHPQVTYRLGARVSLIDRANQLVVLDDEAGETIAYDHLVLATGSYPFVPPVPGRDLDGCFVYRTLDDLASIRNWATDEVAARTVGVVIGGGLLGLEAANALRNLQLDAHVIEVAPYLMPRQLGPAVGPCWPAG